VRAEQDKADFSRKKGVVKAGDYEKSQNAYPELTLNNGYGKHLIKLVHFAKSIARGYIGLNAVLFVY